LKESNGLPSGERSRILKVSLKRESPRKPRRRGRREWSLGEVVGVWAKREGNALVGKEG